MTALICYMYKWGLGSDRPILVMRPKMPKRMFSNGIPLHTKGRLLSQIPNLIRTSVSKSHTVIPDFFEISRRFPIQITRKPSKFSTRPENPVAALHTSVMVTSTACELNHQLIFSLVRDGLQLKWVLRRAAIF